MPVGLGDDRRAVAVQVVGADVEGLEQVGRTLDPEAVGQALRSLGCVAAVDGGAGGE